MGGVTYGVLLTARAIFCQYSKRRKLYECYKDNLAKAVFLSKTASFPRREFETKKGRIYTL